MARAPRIDKATERRRTKSARKVVEHIGQAAPQKRWTSEDSAFMARALELAQRGEGFVEPNPMVGAVIVRGGSIVGEGWHRRYGGPHAEVEALGKARRHCGTKARRESATKRRSDEATNGGPSTGSGTARHGSSLSGTTCYVTLEPCCHFGKTPPCTDALIAAGVTRVVAAVEDPNPVVAGGGFAALRDAGVRVDVGLMAEPARRLNAPFFKLVRTGRPWVILKWAQSIDGKIATHTGESKWITSAASRAEAHALRGRCDAIIVGIGTVLADDPELTCRLAEPRRIAQRVVLDRELRIPASCKLVRTARQTPTLIFTSGAASASRRKRLQAAGCEVCVVGATRAGVSLDDVLAELGRRKMTNVMVEGGARVLGSFFDAGLADEAIVFMAPRLIGGAAAPGALGGVGLRSIDSNGEARGGEWSRCGDDLVYRMRFGQTYA